MYGIPPLQMVECPCENFPPTEILDRVLEQLPEFYRARSLQLKVLAGGCNPPSSNLNLSIIFLFGREKWLAIGVSKVLKK